jgi:hypothetical protein
LVLPARCRCSSEIDSNSDHSFARKTFTENNKLTFGTRVPTHFHPAYWGNRTGPPVDGSPFAGPMDH